MRIEPEFSSASVVMLGSFNPAIFTPAWFVLHNLLPEGVEARADLQVAHVQVTRFTADWLRLDVVNDRFAVATREAPYVRLRDLAVRTFKEFLPHNPLRAFGINREVHFPARGAAERDRLGRALAPVEPWGAVGRDLGLDGKDGGMASLTMSQPRPQGRPVGGRISVKVEPSIRVTDRRGVYVSINDHYTLGKDESAAEADEANTARLIKMLERNFDDSLTRADGIIDHLMSLCNQPEQP